MKLNGLLEDNYKVAAPAYIRAMKTRRSIGSFIGFFIILGIIGSFIQNGFLLGLLGLFVGVVVWWVFNIILNFIFGLIIKDLLRDYSNSKNNEN